MDVIIKNARLRGVEGNKDIGVEEGKISKIASEIKGESRNEIDAEGNLVTPGFVNVHVHLDKCLTGEWMRTAINAEKGSTDIIPLASEAKKKFTESDIIGRAVRAVEDAVSYGTTAIRAFADVDSIGGLTAVKALLTVKERYSKYLDIQVVAFPQEGIIRDPESKELLSKAIELGGDVVGGIPWYEKSEDDSRRHTDFAFELAKGYNKDIHMLIDDTEDPESKNLEYLLARGRQEGFVGRIAATHCKGALDSPQEAYAKRVIELARQVEATIVENSHVSLMLFGRRDNHPIRRGVTRVREFLEAGVNVAIGQDDIDDPYYPFGRGDMMELALFMAHAAHLGSPSEIENAYDMITFNGAKAMRLKNYGISVGDSADLVILKARTVHEALRMQPGCLFVLKNGMKIAENRLERKLNVKAWA